MRIPRKEIAIKILFLLLVLALPFAAQAQNACGTNTGSDALPNPICAPNILTFLKNLYKNFVIYVAGPLAVVLFVWGAFLFLTAAGSEERVRKGKDTMLWTTVGFALLLLVEVIAQLVHDLIVGP